MIFHNLKKLKNPGLWTCFKVGYAADDCVSIVDAGEAYFGKRKVRNRLNVTDEEWRLLTLAYLRASVEVHQGGPWPQYGFPGRTVITYPEAIKLVEDKNVLGDQIVQKNKAHVIQLIDDISKELGERCEVDSGAGCEGRRSAFNA